MRNIEKYNKYYGKNTRDPRKVIYFIIVVFLIITFIFGPLGGGQSNVPAIEDNQMNNPGFGITQNPKNNPLYNGIM